MKDNKTNTKPTSFNIEDFVLVAQIVSTHGLKGWVKFRYYVDNVDNLKQYSLVDNNNNTYKILNFKHTNSENCILVELENITTIEQAQQLKNKYLYTAKQNLPKLNDEEYFYNDLINLQVLDLKKNKIGIVVGVYNFGAGDILEVLLNESLLPENTELQVDNKKNTKPNKVHSAKNLSANNANQNTAKTKMISFTNTNVVKVDLEEQFVVVNSKNLI